MRIFVSHSHKDDWFAHQLVNALRSAGADVWYDEHNMSAGSLNAIIEREVRA
jgi:predicted esterase